MNSFGVINNVYKVYFKISYYAIDWFAQIQIIGVLTAAVTLIFLILSEMVGLRKLFITMISCTTCSYVLSMLAFAYPVSFPLIYVAQFAVGFAFQSSIAIFSTFATSWFPEKQVGLALSIESVSMSTGCLLAYLIPSQLFSIPPPSLTEFDNNNTVGLLVEVINGSSVIDASHWQYETRLKFLYIYGACLLGCIVVWLFAVFFVVDEPPTPPTEAQALVREQRNLSKVEKKLINCKKFLTECKTILSNKTVVLAAIVLTILIGCSYLQKVLMGQISRKVFAFQSYKSEINRMSGYILILFEAGALIGGLAAGKVTDIFNRHKMQLHFAFVVGLCSMLGLTLGRHWFNVIAIFVCNTSLGFALCFSQTPLFDMILQDTYPKSTSLVMLVCVSVTEIAVMIIGQISRLILNSVGGTAVLIFFSVIMAFGLFVSFFFNPKLKRKEVSYVEAEISDDVSLLNENII